MSANVSDRSDRGENDLINEYCSETVFNVTINCTEVRSGMAIYGEPIPVALSFSSLLSNLLVVLVIRQMMRKHMSQAQIHLLCVAFSDLGVGLAFVVAHVAADLVGRLRRVGHLGHLHGNDVRDGVEARSDNR